MEHGLSLVAASGASSLVVMWGLLTVGASLCGARAPGAQASAVVAHGLRSCGSRALEQRLNSCGTWA